MGNSLSGERCDALAAEVTSKYTGDAEGDIRAIYDFLETAEPDVKECLLNRGIDDEFRIRFMHNIFTAEPFAFSGYLGGVHKSIPYGEAYMSCVFSMYDQYKKQNSEDMDTEKLARQAAELVLHGINGVK